MNETTILLVEDDHGLRTFLADNLTADGFDVLLADTVRDAVRLLEYRRPDLALVDIGLPDGSGLELIARVRAADGVASRLDPGVPLVVLTGRAGELDRVRGFERGADDYVVEAVLVSGAGGPGPGDPAADRRARPRGGCGSAIWRSTRRRARCGCAGGGWTCRRRSSRCCARSPPSPTRVFTKEELLRDVWGFRSKGATRTLDSHACRLRQKLRHGRGGGSWSTCGASATGSSTGRRRRAA